MMIISAHKNTTHPPGQILNKIETTLGDYIKRKQSDDTFVLVDHNINDLVQYLVDNTWAYTDYDTDSGVVILKASLKSIIESFINMK